MFVHSGHLVMFVQTAPPPIVIYIIFLLTTPRSKLHSVVVASRYSKWHNVKHGLGFYPFLYRRFSRNSFPHHTPPHNSICTEIHVADIYKYRFYFSPLLPYYRSCFKGCGQKSVKFDSSVSWRASFQSFKFYLAHTQSHIYVTYNIIKIIPF